MGATRSDRREGYLPQIAVLKSVNSANSWPPRRRVQKPTKRSCRSLDGCDARTDHAPLVSALFRRFSEVCPGAIRHAPAEITGECRVASLRTACFGGPHRARTPTLRERWGFPRATHRRWSACREYG
jgi:hypothetical protein